MFHFNTIFGLIGTVLAIGAAGMVLKNPGATTTVLTSATNNLSGLGLAVSNYG